MDAALLSGDAGLLCVKAGLLKVEAALLYVKAGLTNVEPVLLRVQVEVGLPDAAMPELEVHAAGGLLAVAILDLVGAPRPTGDVVGTSTGDTTRDNDERIMVSLAGIALPVWLCAEKCAMQASSEWHQSEGP